MNYWYIARPNELFIDTDNISKSIKHTRARLQGAIECGKLDVISVCSMPSSSPEHLHTIITLKKPLSNIERYVWEIILHGDIYRGCCNIMRGVRGIPAPDILISPHRFFANVKSDTRGDCFFNERLHNDSCMCSGKHTAKVMKECRTAIVLRGKYRTAAFFGKPSKNPCKIWL